MRRSYGGQEKQRNARGRWARLRVGGEAQYEAPPDYWLRPATRDRMAATKGMSASRADGFIGAASGTDLVEFILAWGVSSRWHLWSCSSVHLLHQRRGELDVDRQMALSNPSVWQFTHAEHGEKGRGE